MIVGMLTTAIKRDSRSSRESSTTVTIALPSLHRSQILRDLWVMQAQAEEFSGYAGKFDCFLESSPQ